MSRWPALLRDPVFLVLTAASVFLGGQALAWTFVPMSGILAGGFLAAAALTLQQRRASPVLWLALLAGLIILFPAVPHTAALLVLTLAAMLGLAIVAGLQAPPGSCATLQKVTAEVPNEIAETLTSEFHPLEFINSGEDEESEVDCEEESESSGELLQQSERRQLASGEEVVEATLKLRFAAGERAQTVHLPLHPPLLGIEHVHCEVMDGADLACEVDAVRAFGIRIAVRRRGSSQQPLDSYVWIAISASRASTRAA